MPVTHHLFTELHAAVYILSTINLISAFFPRYAMQARPMPSCSVRLSVSLSVRLSVTFVNSVKMTNNRIRRLFFTVG